MAYMALYRRWRPGTFSDLVGQEHVSRTLANAITAGKIGHAYLFSGPRGTGKTSTAKIFAKALNCEHGPTPQPCGTCVSCQKITDGSSMDVFEIDAASNRGIDEIRDLRETVKFAPVDGRYKVYIIDEVHMLTAEAFNALLKTLEEPPSHVVFVLATTEAHKVPATIKSRCQRYDFKRISLGDIAARLKHVAAESGISADDESLSLIALQADGGMRDALSLLDQCSALSGGNVTAADVRQILGLVGHEWIWQLTAAIAKRDAAKVLGIVADLLGDGKELKQMLAELSLHLRSLLIYQAIGSAEGLDLYLDSDETLKQQASLLPTDMIMQMIQRLHEAMNELKWAPQPRITVEVALLSLCYPEAAAAGPTATADNGRLAQLEAKLAQLAAERRPAPPPSAATPAASPSPATSPPPPSVRPTKPTAVTAVAAAPSATAPPAPVDGSLWQRVLDALQAQGKRAAIACLGQGHFQGQDGAQLLIGFSTEMMAQLAMRSYRKTVEKLLAELSGQSLAFVAKFDKPAAPPKPPAHKPAPPPKPTAQTGPALDLTRYPPEAQASIKKAVAVFGPEMVSVKDD